RVDKDFFVYKHVEIPGFGNDKYYKQDLIVNTTIDLRGKTGKATYSQELGNRSAISWMTYTMQPVYEFFGEKFNGSRGSQAGGITFTSEFSTQVDGPKTDATKGSDGSINIDALTAAFGALSKSGEALKFTMEDLPEWTNQAKDLVELSEDSKGDSPTNSSSNTKQKPVKKSTPQREGPGWQFYVRDKNGKFKKSGRDLGLADSTVKGRDGAPDTIYRRPYTKPPVPKKDIKQN
ncbi:MAG: hypothetical protein M3Y85_08830, partial [Bacteroidota bacterium]|nr:hypothetical protein [Bacteroidota bacterium]